MKSRHRRLWEQMGVQDGGILKKTAIDSRVYLVSPTHFDECTSTQAGFSVVPC